MKSIVNRIKELGFSKPEKFIHLIDELETNHNNLKNAYADLFEKKLQVDYELAQLKENPQNQLKEVSKKLSKTMKELGEDEMISQLVYQRSIILDHFALAYMAETGKKPSECKLVTQPGVDGVEIFFEDKYDLKLHSKDGERIY